MKQIIFVCVLLLLLLVSCSSEPIVTNEELCGEWSHDKLTYTYDIEGNHKRIREGEVFISGTYVIKKEDIIVSYEGETTKSELKIISPDKIKILTPVGMNGFLATELERTKACE